MVTFHIPAGPKNLQTIFPLVNFANVEEYFIELRNKEDLSVVISTPYYKRGCCCNSETIRIFFVNSLGGIDAINFQLVNEDTVVESSSWKKPLQSPMAKWDGGKQRFNVTSNENITAECYCYEEEDQAWLKELISTPNAWVQWSGTQGQTDDYLPIVIRDGSFNTKKREDRYSYVMQIVFEYANENITLRN